MKKYVSISLFVFWAVVVAVLTAGLVFYDKNKSATLIIPEGSPVISNASAVGNSKIVLTAQEIAKHSSPNDCWFIYDGGVYNVTDYIRMHPGGADAIIPYCGKDGTQAFNTKGGSGSHSSEARNILGGYFIGKVGQQASITQTSAAPSGGVVSQPRSNNEENEDD